MKESCFDNSKRRWLVVLMMVWQLVWSCLGLSSAAAQELIPVNEEGVLYDLRSQLSPLVIRDGRRTTTTVNILPEDEIWLVSLRSVDCQEVCQTEVKRLQGGQWVPESLQSLTLNHSVDRTRATLIYWHGNRTNEQWAEDRGLLFYQKTCGDHAACRPPVRFVIVAWRSEREECRPATDYQTKSQRAVQLGPKASEVLQQFPDRNIVLVGFSLGCQVILSALDDVQLHSYDATSGQYRVMLIAPALEAGYASTHRSSQPVSSGVARADVFENHFDRALRASRFLNRRLVDSGDVPIADLARQRHLPLQNIHLYDVADSVGKGHSVAGYTSDQMICLTLNRLLSEVVAPLELVSEQSQ